MMIYLLLQIIKNSDIRIMLQERKHYKWVNIKTFQQTKTLSKLSKLDHQQFWPSQNPPQHAKPQIDNYMQQTNSIPSSSCNSFDDHKQNIRNVPTNTEFSRSQFLPNCKLVSSSQQKDRCKVCQLVLDNLSHLSSKMVRNSHITDHRY